MANTADTGALMFGEDANENPVPIGETDNALDLHIKSGNTGTQLNALTNASINLTIDATKDEVRLDDSISAAAGSSLRLHSSTDCWIAWGTVITEAEDAAGVSAAVAEQVADDGFFFAAGTEVVKVPSQLTSQIWIGAIRDSADGSLNIALVK